MVKRAENLNKSAGNLDAAGKITDKKKEEFNRKLREVRDAAGVYKDASADEAAKARDLMRLVAEKEIQAKKDSTEAANAAKALQEVLNPNKSQPIVKNKAEKDMVVNNSSQLYEVIDVNSYKKDYSIVQVFQPGDPLGRLKYDSKTSSIFTDGEKFKLPADWKTNKKFQAELSRNGFVIDPKTNQITKKYE